MNTEDFAGLLVAARDGNVSAVLAAVDQDLELLNRADEDGWRLLNFACLEGHFELIQGLLERGADVKALDERASDVLSVAAWNNDLKVAELLLDHGADPDSVNDEGPVLHVAARWDRLELAKLLVARGASLMDHLYRGLTALDEYGYRVHLDEAGKDAARAELLAVYRAGPHPSQVSLREIEARWASRWPIMKVAVCCGYRPLAETLLALEMARAATIDPAEPLEPEVLDTPAKRHSHLLSQVLSNDGLLRRVVSFM